MKDFLIFLEEVKTLQFVKEHLPFLIIVPSLLGVIKQIAQISIHSPNLVSSCFSITQIVLDGTLVLLNMPLMLLGLLLYYIFRNFSGKKHKIGILLLTIVAILLYLYLFYITNNIPNILQLIFYLFLNIGLVICYHYQKKMLNQKYGKIAYIIIMALIFSGFINTISTGSEEHIYNFRVLQEQLKLKHPEAIFLYSNDKCILYDLNPNKSDYFIMEYDDIYLKDK
ncbi:hypothetical protein [Chryseobacterium contaminans]|uniref:hypothetical protein n=1 Tax=Chryseobacterium contaminans TaxID=1423959 RepID=UPI003018A4C3